MSPTCSHGVAWKDPCELCEIVSLEYALRWMEPVVKRDRARLAVLQAQRSAVQTSEVPK